MDIHQHKKSFEKFYANKINFDLNGLRKLKFPLVEIEKFDWKRGNYGDIYYSYHYRRFSCHILSKLALSDDHRVLNIGCGFGLDEKNIKHIFPSTKLYSIDISRFMLELAKKSASPTQLSLSAAEALPFPDNSFDRILSREVIEHVMTPLHMVKEINRVLRPGGLAVVTTVNPDSWSPSMKIEEDNSRKRSSINCDDSECSIIDDAPSLKMMQKYIKQSGLILKEYFYDGALYFHLNNLQNRYKDKLPVVAHQFSCLENNRWIASRFCDQLKYVLFKENKFRSRYNQEDKKSIVEYVCPNCKVSFKLLSNEYLCNKCGQAFAIQNGIPDFIPIQVEKKKPEITTIRIDKTLSIEGSIKKGIRAKVYSNLIFHYRNIYSSIYFLAAKIASLFLLKNLSRNSRILTKDDPYQKYMNIADTGK